MASTEAWDGSGSSRGRTAADGSGDGGSLDGVRPGDADFDVDGADETTGLLGAGAHSNGDPEGADRPHATPRDGSWAGDDDFAGLPWWERPSVCVPQTQRRQCHVASKS